MMLRRFDMYIIKTLLLSMVVVFLCIGLLIAMFGVIDESRGADETRSFGTIVLIVLFDLPNVLSAITSYIVLMGGLIGLGTLSQNSEITALRAAGVSPTRLCVPVAIASLLFYAGVFLVAEFIGPQLQSIALSTTTDEDDSGSFGTLWYKEGNTYTQLQVVDSNLNIHGLRQFQVTPDSKLRRARFAANAIPDSQDNTYELKDVKETLFAENRLEVSERTEDTWSLQSELKSLPHRIKYEPADLSFRELRQHVEYLLQEERDPTEFEVEFWSRIARPFSIIGLVLLTVGFVVGPLRETGMGTRIGVGLVVGIMLEYFQRMLIPFASLYAIPAVVVVVIPVLVVFTVGVLLLRRIN
ncbi:MAG: LPS export ABC transporter permease LptG [Gammaproteobacteria bacterium]|nr:LPS export ABC transporter permease LptG [Gammaproteobacteria bacterium]MYC24634.1 LPS export ABC transporter permease LptG [Gammaproteobacteria bacterium]